MCKSKFTPVHLVLSFTVAAYLFAAYALFELLTTLVDAATAYLIK